MSRSNWAGARVSKARALVESRGFPQPCTKCGRPVYRDQAWQADHYLIDRFTAERLGIDMDSLPVGAAHAKCNMSAGGKLGAKLTNSRKRSRVPNQSRGSGFARGIRGA